MHLHFFTNHLLTYVRSTGIITT
ncbi:hypothetical protein ACQ27_gp425 [Klebsiella phage K64-1]|nr:hypothetical protein ACQ27_gp425 [Klebsiella phage K64-1]